MPRGRKTKSKSKETKARSAELGDLRCKFGNVMVGPEKCAVGVSVERTQITLQDLSPIVVGARLQAVLVHDPADTGDVDGQTKFVDTAKARIESVADCPSLNVRPSKFGFRLSFAVGAVDVKELADIAQKTGWVSLTRIGDSGGDQDDEGNAAEE